MMQSPYEDDGVTFVEILASLAILGLVGGLIAITLSSFRISNQHAIAGVITSEVNQVVSHIVDTLGTSSQQLISGDIDLLAYGFSGSSHDLAVVAQSDGTVLIAGYYLVSWKGSKNGDTAIHEYWKPLPHEQSVAPLAYSQKLSDHIHQITFEYLPRSENASELNWVSDWVRKSEIPAAVKVTATYLVGKKPLSLSRVSILNSK